MTTDDVRKAIEAVRNGYVPISEADGVASRKPDRERDQRIVGQIIDGLRELLAFLAERELERMEKAEPGCLCPPGLSYSLCPVHSMVKCQ